MKKINQKQKNNSNGITLIALVVTIIILIILGSIAIGTLTGDNGIIKKAEEAKQDLENAERTEEEQLKKLEEILGITNAEQFKIVRVSNAIKNADISKLPTKETYVGDFIKIKTDDLKALGLDFQGEYYINPITGETYDINGDVYNDIKYHSIEELKQILNCSIEINVKRLLEMKYKQIDYIKNNQQHENGAIATYTRNTNSTYHIIPYFATLACEDLLNDIGSFDAVKKYILWHFENINTTEDINGIVGTIYDCSYDGNVKTTDYKYDSVDSYCSVFLSLLNTYVEKTGDKQLLIDNQNKFLSIVNALDTMYIDDRKLTQTKPNYNISFLMDNAESYRRI